MLYSFILHNTPKKCIGWWWPLIQQRSLEPTFCESSFVQQYAEREWKKRDIKNPIWLLQYLLCIHGCFMGVDEYGSTIYEVLVRLAFMRFFWKKISSELTFNRLCWFCLEQKKPKVMVTSNTFWMNKINLRSTKLYTLKLHFNVHIDDAHFHKICVHDINVHNAHIFK